MDEKKKITENKPDVPYIVYEGEMARAERYIKRLRQAFGGNQPQVQQQDPREVALSRMKQMGIDIPKGMENDPNALIQYVTQNGFVPQERVSMAQQYARNPMVQQMIQRMFGRR